MEIRLERQGTFLTPEKTLSALKKVKQGRIIDLSHTIEMGAPFMAPNQTPYIISSSATAKNSMKVREQMGAKNRVGANLERIEMTTHVGTHIDSLGHFSIGEHLYGGHTICLLYTSPSPRDATLSRMPASA